MDQFGRCHDNQPRNVADQESSNNVFHPAEGRPSMKVLWFASFKPCNLHTFLKRSRGENLGKLRKDTASLFCTTEQFAE